MTSSALRLSTLLPSAALLLFAASTASLANAQAAPAYDRLPLQFEVNQGQAEAATHFLAHGQGYEILLAPTSATFALHREDKRVTPGTMPATSEVIHMSLAGADTRAAMSPERQLPGYVNYLHGSDPNHWQTGIPTYSRTRVSAAWPGVDVVYYGSQRRLEYDFIVAPNASPDTIRLALAGVRPVLAADGSLTLQAGKLANSTDLRFEKPVLYQEFAGVRNRIDGAFRITANGEVGFQVGPYDHTRDLIIDPILSYASYFGGSGEDEINGSALNSAGQLYAVGQTYSTTLPGTAGELEPTSPPYAVNGGNGHDGFVTKFSADGSSVLWTTFLGGSLDTFAYAVAVSSADHAYITGQTNSTGSTYYQSGVTNQIVDFPLAGLSAQSLACPVGANAQGAIGYPPYTQEVSGNCTTAFVSELSSDGKTLLYSTFLGGANGDSARAIAVDGSGNFYVAGYTYSTLYQSNANSQGNVPSYSVLYPTTGYPGTADFPTTNSAYETATAVQQATDVNDGHGNFSGGQGVSFPVAFLTAFNSSDAITYSTTIGGGYLGSAGNGTSFQGANSVAVGLNGIVYVGGTTDSFTFPTTAGTFSNVCAAYNPGVTPPICNINGWVAAFDTTKSGVASKLFSTYMTGLSAGQDYQGNNIAPTSHVNGMTTDSSGNVIVTGDTNANNMLTSSTGFQPTCNPHGDGNADSNVCSSGFLAKLTSNGSTAWSTYIHGTTPATGTVSGTAVQIGSDNNVYVLALATDSTLPLVNTFTTNGARQNDALLLEFTPTATALLGGTYLGAGGGVYVNNNSLQLDSNLIAYFSGSQCYNTYGGTFFPVTANAFSKSIGGNCDGYVVKMITQQQPSATALAVTPTTGIVTPSQTVTLTATVTTPSTIGGASRPTGTVNFLNGATTVGTATLNTAGTATYSGTLATGSYTITASYPGDIGFNASVSTVSALSVSSAVVTSTTLAVAPASSAYSSGATLTATVLAGTAPATSGTVTFTAGTVLLGTATVSSTGVATLTVKPVVGIYSVIATYAGTYNQTSNPTGYNSSASTASAGTTITITKATTAVSQSSSAATAGTGTAFILTATVPTGATGSVSFYNGTTLLGTGTVNASGVATYTATFTTAGTLTITSVYTGDTNYSGSTSTSALTVVVLVPTFTVTSSPSSLTISRGTTGSTTFTVTPVGGYTGTVSFACGTLPTNATCTFNPTTVTVGAVAVTDTLTIGTGIASSSLTRPVLTRPVLFGPHAAAFAGALLGLLGLARRRKLIRSPGLFLTLLALTTLTALTGCSSSSPNTANETPAGSYSITVTTTGPNTTAQVATLTVVVQ